MKIISLGVIIIVFFGCFKSDRLAVPKYYDLVRGAELDICKEKYEEATRNYEKAFGFIGKPFGKDLFNAALASHLSNNSEFGGKLLQSLINNSDDLDYVKSVFVGNYVSEAKWQTLISKREIEYNYALREEFKEMFLLDQMFRPMYDTHDDTINANRKINLDKIITLAESTGFPSHTELGYTENLRRQKYDIVLHHTAQRRSRDKTVVDLEPILFKAVEDGNFDPDRAIFYLNFQNDPEKGVFEVFSTWQYKHQLLPDSLNEKVWLQNLSEQERLEAEAKRKKWHANSLDDIAIKSSFLANSDLPFIFTCVQHSIANLSDDFDASVAAEQYAAFTSGMKVYE